MKGVLVGADRHQEWLLPWWWTIYRRYNSFPVAFADLGMTPQARKWCQERGEVFEVASCEIKTPSTLSVKRVQHLDQVHEGSLIEKRKCWFQKPLACLKTPFSTTAWIDLDCEVCGPLDPLFEIQAEIAVARQKGISQRWEIYNSGVLVFQQKSPLIPAWVERCEKGRNRYLTDDNILSSMIRKEKERFEELPELFNWYMFQGYHVGALILHWMGSWGKKHIYHYGGMHGLKGCDCRF